MESGDDLRLFSDNLSVSSLLENYLTHNIDTFSRNIRYGLNNRAEELKATQNYASHYSLENIKFIGTMNEDESGNCVSGRVLDRANKITLKHTSLGDMKALGLGSHSTNKFDAYNILIIFDNKLEEVIEILKSSDRNYISSERLRISPRTLIGILSYIDSAERYSTSNDIVRNLIEMQICQRVLSKLSANDEKEVLNAWYKVCGENGLHLGEEIIKKLTNALED